MDEQDEFEPGDDQEEEEAAVNDGAVPEGSVIQGVRIFGAEPAGSVAAWAEPRKDGEPEGAGNTAGALEEHYLGFAQPGAGPTGGPLDGEPSGRGRQGGTERAHSDDREMWRYLPGESSGTRPLLPHWTEPPTGQVPAIVERQGADADPLSGQFVRPTWRVHDHDWDDAGFDASLFADDDTRVGALDDAPSEPPPWEFEDFSAPSVAAHPLEPTAARETPARDDQGADEEWVGEKTRRWVDDFEEEETLVDGEQWVGNHADVVGGSADAREASARSRDEATARHVFADTREVAGAVPAGVAASAVDLRRSGGPPADDTVIAHVSSSPLRNSPEPPDGSVGGRLRRRRAASAKEHAGGGTGRGAGRSVPLAILTGVAFALVALGCLASGALATLVLSTVVVTLAVAECYAALRKAGHQPATLLGLAATIGLMVGVYQKGVAALPLVLVLFVVTTMLWYLVGAGRGSPLAGISTSVLAFVWIAVLGSFAALMLAPGQYPHGHGVAFMLGAIVAAVADDVGALAVGAWLGRHPLAPGVSPRKTWEGLVGGAVVAVAVSAAITGHVHPWTPGKAALLGLVAAAVAPIGDLCESMIKRDLRLKDMGSLLPGHGGVLDRVDALLFVLPATYYLVRVLHLG